ncbi:Internal alternative NAD(P)H-ubiquinone oxidoreductase A2 [Chlorella vulgaris]
MRRALTGLKRLAQSRCVQNPVNSIHTSAPPELKMAGAPIPLTTGRQRLVVLGTGWGGARLARDIDTSKYDITIISPRNHMVFTPLLASSTVGTIEARSVTVPIVDIQPGLQQPQNFYYAAECKAVHQEDRLVECCSGEAARISIPLYSPLALLCLLVSHQLSPCKPVQEARHSLPASVICWVPETIMRRALTGLKRLAQSRCVQNPVNSIHTSAPPELKMAGAPIPLTTGRQRLVVLGTGWGGARLARDIDTSKYDITIISPRNHMVFTPLLASSTVGTIEARSVTVPIVDIQPGLQQPQNFYYAAECKAVHQEDRLDGLRFFVEYDHLAISTGSQGSTFGVPGVEQYTHFLRDASHSTAIRSDLVANWNKANIPGRSPLERDRLLHVVVVGGGPTGVEFAGELADFINKDLRKIDPGRARDMRITIVEANELLGSFDTRLREYTARKLVKEGVQLIRGVVKQDGTQIPFGLCVWSTGVGPTPFTVSLPFVKTPRGRLAIDDRLRVLTVPKLHRDGHVQGAGEKGPGPQDVKDVDMQQDEEDTDLHTDRRPVGNVYALGDCCANSDTPLPALAQVAEQQGKWLAKVLNQAAGKLEREEPPPFVYKHLGSMASIGGASAVIELGDPKQPKASLAGFTSWLAWRSAYLTRLGTFKHRSYPPPHRAKLSLDMKVKVKMKVNWRPSATISRKPNFRVVGGQPKRKRSHRGVRLKPSRPASNKLEAQVDNGNYAQCETQDLGPAAADADGGDAAAAATNPAEASCQHPQCAANYAKPGDGANGARPGTLGSHITSVAPVARLNAQQIEDQQWLMEQQQQTLAAVQPCSKHSGGLQKVAVAAAAELFTGTEDEALAAAGDSAVKLSS